MTMLKLDETIPPYTGGGMANYIRWNKLSYTPEEIYLIHNNISEPPKCKYCGQKCAFISYFKGYKNHCDSAECNKKASREGAYKTLALNAERIIDYGKFVSDNIDFYKNTNFPFIDPYDGNTVNDIESFKHKLTHNNFHLFDEERECVICKNKFIFNKLTRDKNCCFSKKCICNFRILGFGNDLNLDEYNKYSDKIDINIFKLNKKFGTFTNEELAIICKKYNNEDTQKLIKKLAIEYNGYFLERITTDIPFSFCTNNIILDEMKNKCIVCGKEYIKYDIKIYTNLKTNILKVKKVRVGALYVCKNRSCYNEALKMHLDGYKTSQKSRLTVSRKLKSKIKNGTFTPCVTNSWTSRIELKYNNIAFRSTWELYFYIYNLNIGKNLLYENVRIPYFDTQNNKERIYIVDFIDFSGKTLYEIKPECNVNNQNTIDKEKYALKYCLKNNMKYIIISNKWFKEHYNSKLLDVLPDFQKEKCKKPLSQFEG